MFYCLLCLESRRDDEKAHPKQVVYRYAEGWFCAKCAASGMEWVRKILLKLGVDKQTVKESV